MALIAVAADKGSPGVTVSSVALAAVWPRPVLLAECDPAGGDLAYWLPSADGGQLDSRRGLLSLAVAARRGLRPRQVWEHTQKLSGGLDVLAGVTSAEQGAGLEGLWGPVGAVLSALPGADVIADCGRVGADGPFVDLLAQAAAVVLITRAALGDVVRLRERVTAVAAALHRRGRPGVRVGVVVIADHRSFSSAVAEVGRALADGGRPAAVLGGIAFEPKSADQLRGEWGGKLDRSLLIRTARQIAAELSAALPAGDVPAADIPAGGVPATNGRAASGPASAPAAGAPAMRPVLDPPAAAGWDDRAVRPARQDRWPAGPDPRLPPGPDPGRVSQPGPPPAESPRRGPAPAGEPDPSRGWFASRGKHAEPPREPALGPDPRENGPGEPAPAPPRPAQRGEW